MHKLPSVINIPNNSYCLFNEEHWHTCREQFHNYFKADTKGFYFSFSQSESNYDNVVGFIKKTEEILECNDYETRNPDRFVFDEDKKSKFDKTNKAKVVAIEPCFFWKECVMRRSLFTILLRCGVSYDVNKDNYEEALLSNSYINRTRKAVYRFLFGHYDLNKKLNTDGWVTAFCNMGEKEILGSLVNIKKKKQNKGLQGLWI